MPKLQAQIINVPGMATFEDTRQALLMMGNNLQQQLLRINPNDGGGQPIVNVAPPENVGDVVTLEYLNQALQSLRASILSTIGTATS